MTYHRSSVSETLNDYANIRSIPALLSVLFIVSSAYQFGGIGSISFEWIDYTLTVGDAALISLGTYLVAFMSSETKRFENYEQEEQALIIAGPLVVFGQQYITAIDDLLLELGDPLGYQIAFVLVVISWTVAVR